MKNTTRKLSVYLGYFILYNYLFESRVFNVGFLWLLLSIVFIIYGSFNDFLFKEKHTEKIHILFIEMGLRVALSIYIVLKVMEGFGSVAEMSLNMFIVLMLLYQSSVFLISFIRKYYSNHL